MKDKLRGSLEIDFHSLLSAIEILGFEKSEQDTILKILSAVLHLGNVYFNRKHVNQNLMALHFLFFWIKFDLETVVERLTYGLGAKM